ncbi:hypothetical protein NQ315_008559 [Exocentrus adspersus]|uniref:Uncharacterized protein n=1 Tax=Exocentrus adspersus TaxID=1586481 RepID=A0AAV8W5N9_9CUCU|nr:hypothetical protein NQ315_008559 [Exocentrus adspersus]
MFSLNSCSLLLPFAFLLLTPDGAIVACNKTNSIWSDAGTMTGILLHNCMRLGAGKPTKQFLLTLQECLRHRILLAFDRMLGMDVIELAEGVALVRYQQKNHTEDDRVMELSKSASRFDDKEESWKSQIVGKLTQLFRTHVLKIQLRELNGFGIEARRRHQKKSMMAELLMFALIAAGVIVIPLGFQFLAILGGKALLLAKMALLMTSIQGLKKIATSSLNYGLYTYGHGHGQQEPCKGDYDYDCDKDDVSFSVEFEDLAHSRDPEIDYF